jgi:hypothetical protein
MQALVKLLHYSYMQQPSFMDSNPLQDSSDEDCELDRPLPTASLVNIITLNFPDTSIKGFVIDEDNFSLDNLRLLCPEFNSSPTALVSNFSVKAEEVTVKVSADMEAYSIRQLVDALELRRFLKEGVLELHWCVVDPSCLYWESLDRQPDEILRDEVKLTSDLLTCQCILAVKRTDDELELVLHNPQDNSQISLKASEIDDLYPTDGTSLKVEGLTDFGEFTLSFSNPENMNLLMTSVLQERCSPVPKCDDIPVHQLQDSRHFLVKKKNRYGLMQKRIIWLSYSSFSVSIAGLKMKSVSTYDLSSVAHFIRKGKGQRKVLMEFNARDKDIFIVFTNADEVSEFLAIAQRFIHSKSSCKLKARQDLVFTQEIAGGRRTSKRYTWLSDGQPPESLSYHVVLVKQFSKENRVLTFDLEQRQLLLKDGLKLVKAFPIQLLVLHQLTSDPHKLRIGSDTSILVIFSSVYAKSHFCAQAYSLKYPESMVAPDEVTLRTRQVSVFVGTWNLGHQSSSSHSSLSKWLQDLQQHQVVALGFQECKKSKRGEWITSINSLLECDGFSLLAFEFMWEMFILVYVQKSLLSRVSHVVKQAKATGIANVLGNKGGVLVSFRIEETSYCFLSCHLAASQHKIQPRNHNMSDLLRLKPSHCEVELTQEFDYTFVFGDLNYRVDEDFFLAVALLKQEQLEPLLLKDQLNKQRKLNQVLSNFHEPEINFKPTYRVRRDSAEWSNKKNQTPSWTDRILYRAHRPIRALLYASVPTALGSDHRPVLGTYLTEVVSSYLPTNLKPLQTGSEKFAFLEFKSLSVRLDDTSPAKVAQVTFYAPFIEQCRGSFQVPISCHLFEFEIQGEQMPMLRCVWSDLRFLREQRLLVTLLLFSESNSSQICGVASLSLASLVETVESNPSVKPIVPFEGRLELGGVEVGQVVGMWTYNEVE